jgi:enoyl-CoA hydratase/carnithine racemase
MSAERPTASNTMLVTEQARGPVLILTLNRPEKRNAINDGVIARFERIFGSMPSDIRCVVLASNGDHFSAGLDLSDLSERDVPEGILHSMSWHRAFERMQFGPVPIVSALKGGVIGGGLELALATHIRVAERSTYYALPEGQRGIYVGGGASVRLPRLIGTDRMMDMMLTGRTLTAEDGQAMGLSQYLVEAGQGLAKAIELAERISKNPKITNFAVVQALPRIAEADRHVGFFMESLMAGVAQGEPDAKARLQAFLDGKAAKVKPQT